MKHIFLLTLLLNFLFANQLNIEKKYLIDINNNMTLKEILQKKEKFSPITKSNFGIVRHNLWIHILVTNNSKKKQIKRFYNKRAGLDYVDVYILKDDNLIEKYSLGDMKDYKNRDNIFRVSYFDLELEGFEKLDIYIKQKSFGSMETNWQAIKIDAFNNYYNKQEMVYFIIFGILIVVTVTSFGFFLVFRKKHYLTYSLFTICSTTYQFAVAGFFYEFEFPIYLVTISNYVVPLIALILLGMFPFSFFNIKKDEYKVIKKILKALLGIVFVIAMINLFYPIIDSLLYDNSITNIINILTMLMLLLLSLKVYKEKKQGSGFYLIANLILFFAITYFILGLVGVISNNEFYYYSLAFGSIGQDLFLAFALVHATYLIKKEHEKNAQLLNEYSKLTFIGQTMINISHQWKSPINNIYNSINHIDVAREFNDKNIDKIIDKNLKNIKDITLYLRDTALSQLNFYKEEKNIEKIDLKKEIDYIINLINREFIKKSILIEVNCKDNLKIEIEKNYFFNLLMILFENSLKAFERNKVKQPKIKLFIKEIENKIEVCFEDNAGGINIKHKEKIFEKDFSKSSSTGIGLYLAKEIVSKKLNGQITAENKNEGLCFKIVF